MVSGPFYRTLPANSWP